MTPINRYIYKTGLLLLTLFYFQVENITCQQLHRNLFLRVFYVDTDTLPIENTVARSNGYILGVSSPDGIMKLRLSESDTVLFLSHLGFETQKISITNYEQRFFNIEMKRNSILISEINVNATKPKYRRYKMGITKSRNGHVRFIHRNALFIPNKLQLEGYTIESVHIYIHNMGNPYTPFYISIYEAEADSVAPNDALKRIGQIRTIAKKSEGFHVVDISAHKIAFGSTGMFVEIEADLEAESAWELAIKRKSYFVDTNKTIGIGEAWDEMNKCYGWYFRSDSGWQREVIHRVNVPRNVEVYLGNPMIYVTVSKIRTK